MIKLLAMDLDGTLLSTDRHISDENIKAVRMAIEKGVIVTLNSGRGFTGGVKQYAEILGLRDVPVIACNGAEIRRLYTGERLWGTYLDEEALVKLEKTAKKYNFATNFYCDDDSLRYDRENYCSKFFENIVNDFDGREGADVRCAERTSNILKAEFVTDDEKTVELSMPEFENLCGTTMYYAMLRFEMISRKADKGQALKQLAQEYGFTPDEVMAIGDAVNDVPMFEYAGCSVAMGQALPVFSKHAKHTTDDNNHSGVAKAIYEYIG